MPRYVTYFKYKDGRDIDHAVHLLIAERDDCLGAVHCTVVETGVRISGFVEELHELANGIEVVHHFDKGIQCHVTVRIRVKVARPGAILEGRPEPWHTADIERH